MSSAVHGVGKGVYPEEAIVWIEPGDVDVFVQGGQGNGSCSQITVVAGGQEGGVVIAWSAKGKDLCVEEVYRGKKPAQGQR